jgi:DNA-binding NtrC family response regulator
MSRVLVVEDHADTREVLCELLAEMGYVAVGVESAERGLEELATNAYDVLIVDYWLAGGRTGSWLVDEARVRNVLVPTLMCTGQRLPPDVGKDVTVLQKPVDVGALVQHVERLNKRAPPARRESPHPVARIDLVFYITASAVSLRGLRNLQRFLRRLPPERFTLEVVDLTSAPAEAQGIAFTPMLVKKAPGALERMVGDFRDTNALEDMFSRG